MFCRLKCLAIFSKTIGICFAEYWQNQNCRLAFGKIQTEAFIKLSKKLIAKYFSKFQSLNYCRMGCSRV